MPFFRRILTCRLALRNLTTCASGLFTIALVSALGCAKAPLAQTAIQSPPQAAALNVNVSVPFRFVAYGDTRFHDPRDTKDANPAARIALVDRIAAANPAFICFTGDIVYNGYDENDWKVFDTETLIWREKHIPIFPALGNHEYHGNVATALANYFQRFPELNHSRFYSVRAAANTLLLVLDSDADETSGPEGQWLNDNLNHIPPEVDFVFVMLHHPPYTSSAMNMRGEGHSARSEEKELASLLENRQSRTRARFVVFSGHVHNYERHERGGVTYFVSGGGGAHAYPVHRAPDDPYQSKEINYHYLLVEVDHQQLKVTMNRLQLEEGKPVWTQPDSITISVPAAAAASVAAR